MRQRELSTTYTVAPLPVYNRFQQQLGQPFLHRMRQPKRANHVIGMLAIMAEMLSGMEAGITVLLEKLKKVISLDEIQLARLRGLDRHFIRLTHHRGV